MKRGLWIGIALVGALVPSWRGVVTVDSTALPVPGPAIRVGSASWLVVGRRDLAGFLVDAAPALGWTVKEQLGSMHVLHRPGQEAHLVQRITASVFTRVDVDLRPR